MRTFTINIPKRQNYTKPPTKIIYDRLLSTGKINPGDMFKAHYSSNTGKITIQIDENQTNLARARTEARKFELDDTEFR